MNVYPQVFDSGVWSVMPEDGAFTLYAGETYFICLEFEDITSAQEYEITIIPRISLVSEHWNCYGNLFDDSSDALDVGIK
jgi:hypothetical protein